VNSRELFDFTVKPTIEKKIQNNSQKSSTQKKQQKLGGYIEKNEVTF
jgi:hypothetical protein